ncbi:hypothetical protein Q1695_007432 [Nippostrongylus brasiliensis]|nr:hypothetical protein Q1695_007432 [Nippostrongylus brasiliensis]
MSSKSSNRSGPAADEVSRYLLKQALDDAVRQRYGMDLDALARKAGVGKATRPRARTPTKDEQPRKEEVKSARGGQPQSKTDSKPSGKAASAEPPHHVPGPVQRSHTHYGRQEFAQGPPEELAGILADIAEDYFTVSKSGYALYLFRK